MDLDEWEVLSDDGFIDQDGGRNFFPKEKRSISTSTSNIVDMNYFHKLIEPPPETQKDLIPIPIPIPNTNQVSVVPVSISYEDPQEEVVKEVITDEEDQILPVFPTSPSISETEKQMISSVPKVEEAFDMETITHQVSFNKTKETNQFVDMKLDSPKSLNMGILPQIDVGMHQFEDKVGDLEGDEKTTLEMIEKEKEDVVCWEDEVDHHGTDKSNLWKFGMTGIGALFSFGFACATTVCIIALGSHQKEKQHRQRVHFHVFADDKSINQVVHHANKLNEAISGLRSGTPVSRAQITIGGYFEGL